MQLVSHATAGAQVAAWLSHIKTETIAYPGCTLQYNGKQCNKKVTDAGGAGGDMAWYCERCGQHCQAEYRYMLNLQLEDHTGKEWVTAFQVPPLRLTFPCVFVLVCRAVCGRGFCLGLPGWKVFTKELKMALWCGSWGC